MSFLMDSLPEWRLIGVAPTKSYIQVGKSPNTLKVVYKEEHSFSFSGSTNDISREGDC